MEQQPESMDMDMNDVEWEIGTQKGGAFITQRQGFSQITKLKHAQSGDSIFILNISALNRNVMLTILSHFLPYVTCQDHVLFRIRHM